jgi:membrane fusion protein, multidrug efflux system
MSHNLPLRTRLSPSARDAVALPARRRGSVATPAVAAALAALVASACRTPEPVMTPPEVTVAPAITRQVTEWEEFTGHVEAVNAVEVRPRVSGFVQRVAFTEGAIVNKGDVLFEIDRRPYEAEVARLEAEAERARTRKSLSQAELERAQRLVSTQAISREELDARTSGSAEGDAVVRAAEAALRTARLNLEWATVRAPISGRVGRAEVTGGNLVQAGPPAATLLTTIVSVSPVYVYFDTDEQAYLKYIRSARDVRASRGSGQSQRTVQIGLANEPGFPHEGTLDFVDNRVDPSAGTIRARAVVPNTDRAFTPGLFARVRLPGGERHAATLIQDQAIGTDQDRKFVLVLKPDSSVEYRAIALGRIVDGLRVVQSGLKPGENVVINGLLRVRPGMKVAVKQGVMSADSTALARAP